VSGTRGPQAVKVELFCYVCVQTDRVTENPTSTNTTRVVTGAESVTRYDLVRRPVNALPTNLSLAKGTT
jgi:hypothetical protein